MEQGKDSITDEAIWKETLKQHFLPPPTQWTFHDNVISFRNNHYKVDDTTMYELALLDIHAQYWEVTGSDHLRRYHRSLQYKVEEHFQSNKAMEVRKTPPLLRSWLVRIIFKKPHDAEGREITLKIVEDIPAAERSKLKLGDLQPEDWKAVISHRYHQVDLNQMIKRICIERRIPHYGNTKYSWRLPIFHCVVRDNGETFTTMVQSSIPSFCPLYQRELTTIVATGSLGDGGFQWDTTFINSPKLPRTIMNIPFSKLQAERLLTRTWIDDEVINAYLCLCGYLRPDIKFISTHWPTKIAEWGDKAKKKSISWISKDSPNISLAMCKFTAVITVMNQSKNHWVTLRFNPKEKTLEVFDSLQSGNFSNSEKKYEKNILKPLGLIHWNVQEGKDVPQQQGTLDCGLYAAQFAKYCALGISFFPTLDKEQTFWIRRMMAIEITDGRIRMP